MGSRGFRRYARSFLDIPRWMGAEHLKRNARSIRSMLRGFSTVKKPELEETFEQAITRMGLNEQRLEERKAEFFRLAMIYLAAALGAFAYLLYLIFHGHYRALMLSLTLVIVLFSFFFREHFWYTQMKYRRLGMTFGQWLRSLFQDVSL